MEDQTPQLARLEPDLARLLADLKRDEGLRLKPYRDSVGKLTIGYGRNLDSVGISEEEASTMLASDVARATLDVEGQLPWAATLDPVRQRVLVEMAFNMGIEGLLTFQNTLSAIREARWADASDGLLASLADHQEPARVGRWATAIKTGAYPDA
ncbi:MAG TPA: glycoside hydrolase family protein [Candidatus Udaeobacter sp.]|nr:glycoside hydrolase family protein [Candidatus Udaeobacter sp.]